MPHFSREQLSALLARAQLLGAAQAEELIRASVNDTPGLVEEMLGRLRLLVDTHPLDDIAARLERSTGLPYAELGPWRLRRVIDQGGSSTICEADREDDFQKRVAIKILDRIGPAEVSAVRRFLAERQFLADLEHPHIARLIDGGTAPRGEPYLVLELIDGRPLDEYCSAQRLDLKQILVLLGTIAQTVHFAHQRLLIHRDLKPRNILVTHNGTPKLLDFGAAKQRSILADTTRRSHAPMTVLYASPEQVSGGLLSTATDIYSLGVVLYQLVTHRSPYSVSLEEPYALTRAIVESTPQRPSQLLAVSASAQINRRDLDAVILKCLAKTPAQRYASMAALADDLHALAHGSPVAALVPSRWERAARFLKRHRLATALATAAVVALLSLTVVLLIALERTRVAQSGSEASLALLFEVLGSSNDGLATRPLDARELLLKARNQVNQRFANSPLERMQLQARIARAFRSLGFNAEALPAIVEARALAAAASRSDWADFALMEAQTRFASGDYTGTLTTCAEILRPATELPLPSKVLRNQAEMLRAMAALTEDATRGVESVAGARRAAAELLELEPAPQQRVEIMTRLGEIELRAGDTKAAAASFSRALEASAGRSVNERSTLQLQLMRIARAQGDFDRAKLLGQDALAAQIATYGADSPRLIILYSDIAIAALSAGELDDAQRASERAMVLIKAINPNLLQPFAPGVVGGLARIAMERGELDVAVERATRAVALAHQLFKDNSADVAVAELTLAMAQYGSGDITASAALGTAVQQKLESTLGTGNILATRAQEFNGRIAAARGDRARAAELFATALKGRRLAYGEHHPLVTLLRVRLAIADDAGPLDTELALAWQRSVRDSKMISAATQAEIAAQLALLAQKSP